MSAQSHKEVVITDNIRSITGVTNVQDKIEYSDGRLLIDIGNDELVSKRMLTSFPANVGNTYKIPAGSPHPAVLTNGNEFTTNETDVNIQCKIADPVTAHTRTTNGAPTIFDVQLNNSETVILTITIQTNSIDGTTVEQDTWVRIV